jgi:alpha-tubulin suppressor-like RCC1 family protein
MKGRSIATYAMLKRSLPLSAVILLTAIRQAVAQPAGGLTFQSVSVGSNHNCGVTTAGAAYCWGSNGVGRLGDGTLADSNVPVGVDPPF